MPEWSIGPHSKCGVRATVPGVRIPLFPLNKAYKKLIVNLVGFFYAQKDAPKMHRPYFYALLRVSSLTNTNLTTNPKKNNTFNT